MYMFCFGILSRFNFNMATTNTAMTTAKKTLKDGPCSWTPQTPYFFSKFLIFLIIHYPYKLNFMIMQNILLNTAKWNCYNPLEASLKIKKFPPENYVIKTIFFQWHYFFQRHSKLFDWSEAEDSIWTRDKNHLS